MQLISCKITRTNNFLRKCLSSTGVGRRVVVTGLGLVTPLGIGVEPTWSNLISSKCGIGRIDRFSTENLNVKVAGLVPNFQDKDCSTISEEFTKSRFIKYAIAAANEALEDSDLSLPSSREGLDIGVSIGSGVGGLEIVENVLLSSKQISPYFVPQILANSAAGCVSVIHNLRGPNISASTACTTGVHSIGDAANLIKLGYVNVMVAGSSEAAVCPLTISGFSKARALARGESAVCSPFDIQRKGFVLGEGAAILVLEDLNHAISRNAKIYAELKGYGLSGDAFHMTAPSSDASGAVRSMQSALRQSNMSPKDIGYINAHATGTKIGDLVESKAIEQIFFNKPLISSTKGATGHLLGASGSVEAVFSILALTRSQIPPTLNLVAPDPQCDLNHVTSTISNHRIGAVLTNSFGFGGTNGSLIFTKI